MTTTLIADAPIEVDHEVPAPPGAVEQSIAESIAHANDIPELTDRHWLVVRFMRERYLETGTAPPSARSARVRGSSPKAVPALPEGPREARGQDRRHPQAEGLHL